ncbi:recombinase family protein [Candidatus Chloroploca asiatica]|uniref:Resolvase/invertase-type recombinase catalytic domain-containing protein n=1 Tax=Candidatus Chloroploca asiatica TaxID=1506545 RepID=A0A2H3KQK6_9CHLR|nr:recombinase family protein [Candidatus Chloroploca asiatica]PDV97446.1 hypothetical protein A9Q02_18295 [Candidatus Chloroploca asiatica]
MIVHKLDRFFRRAHLLLQTIEEFERHGVTFVSVNEQIDFSTPIGRVMLANLAAFAEYYSRNLGEETRKGHREKARQGKAVGPVPVGYRKDDQGVLVPSDDAEVVREIFRLYATGQYSYGDIADAMNQRGHRLPSVKYTTPEESRREARLPESAIQGEKVDDPQDEDGQIQAVLYYARRSNGGKPHNLH